MSAGRPTFEGEQTPMSQAPSPPPRPSVAFRRLVWACPLIVALGACLVENPNRVDGGGAGSETTGGAGSMGEAPTDSDSGSTRGGSTAGSETGEGDGATCGNGVVEPGETCDDGNLDDADGCDSDCRPTPAACGDGFPVPGERCHVLVEVPLPGPPTGFGAGDLDGDGDATLAVATPTLDRVVLVEIAEDPVTTQEVLLGTPATAVAIADVTVDGIPDLVAGGAAGVFVAPGDGQGIFDAPAMLDDGEVLHLVTADASPDGRRDILAVRSKGQPVEYFVTFYLAEGGMSFQPVNAFFQASLDADPRPVAALDATGDGLADLLAADPNGGGLGLWVAAGPAQFGASPDLVLDLGAAPVAITAHDADGDGAPDLAVGLAGASSVTVLRATGPGTFGLPVTVPLDAPVRALATGDLDGDGVEDLVAALEGGIVSLLRRTGPLAYEPFDSLDVEGPMAGVVAADLDGDGLADVAAARATGQTVRVLRSNP